MISQKTKMERMSTEYNRLKAKHPDSIILFDTEKGYELFGQDIEVGKKILNLDTNHFAPELMEYYLFQLVKSGKHIIINDEIDVYETKLNSKQEAHNPIDNTDMPRNLVGQNGVRKEHIRYYAYSRLDKMEADDPKRQQYEDVLKASSRIGNYFAELQKKGLETKEERKVCFDEYCKRHRSDGDIRRFEGLEDLIHSIPLPDYEEKVSSYQMKLVEVRLMENRKELLDENKKLLEGEDKEKKETLEKIEENKKKYAELGKLLADKQGIRQVAKAAAR